MLDNKSGSITIQLSDSTFSKIENFSRINNMTLTGGIEWILDHIPYEKIAKLSAGNDAIYSCGDEVCFNIKLDNSEEILFNGIINSIYSSGTFCEIDEPTYDVLVAIGGKGKFIAKHIRQSNLW